MLGETTMIQRLKEKASKSWGRLTPDQKRWLGWGVIFAATGCLWRLAQTLHPTLGLSVVGATLFAAITLYCVGLPRVTPALYGIRVHLALFLTGGWLNWVASLANRGFMPVAVQEAVAAIYRKGLTHTYWWLYIGDWIGGAISPGDILIIAGFLGIIITILRRHNEAKGLYSH